MANNLKRTSSLTCDTSPPRSSLQQLTVMNTPSYLELNQLRFLILDAPHNSNLAAYITELKKHNVTDVVRTCSLTYDESILVDHGFRLHRLMFDDGGPPSDMILEKWLEIVHDCSRRGTTVAVHCLAGLGRAPVLVVVALIEHGIKNLEAVEFVRAHRRGAINKKQLEYLMSYKIRRRRFNCCTIM